MQRMVKHLACNAAVAVLVVVAAFAEDFTPDTPLEGIGERLVEVNRRLGGIDFDVTLDDRGYADDGPDQADVTIDAEGRAFPPEETRHVRRAKGFVGTDGSFAMTVGEMTNGEGNVYSGEEHFWSDGAWVYMKPDNANVVVRMPRELGQTSSFEGVRVAERVIAWREGLNPLVSDSPGLVRTPAAEGLGFHRDHPAQNLRVEERFEPGPNGWVVADHTTRNVETGRFLFGFSNRDLRPVLGAGIIPHERIDYSMSGAVGIDPLVNGVVGGVDTMVFHRITPAGAPLREGSDRMTLLSGGAVFVTFDADEQNGTQVNSTVPEPGIELAWADAPEWFADAAVVRPVEEVLPIPGRLPGWIAPVLLLGGAGVLLAGVLLARRGGAA